MYFLCIQETSLIVAAANNFLILGRAGEREWALDNHVKETTKPNIALRPPTASHRYMCRLFFH